MKTCLLIVLCAALGFSLVRADEPRVVAAEAVAPADLGMHKWFFEATPEAGKVFVLRTRTRKGDETEWKTEHESIINAPGKLCRAYVLLIDHSFFGGDHSRGNYTVKVGEGEGSDSGYSFTSAILGSYHFGQGDLEMSFARADGKPETMLFTVHVETWDEVKKRIPKLPPAVEAFKWSYVPGL